MFGKAAIPTTWTVTGGGPPGRGLGPVKTPPYASCTVSPACNPRSLATAKLGTISSVDDGSIALPSRILAPFTETPNPSGLTRGNTLPGLLSPGTFRYPLAIVT